MSVLNGVGPKGTRMLCEHIEGSLIDGAFTAHLARELGSYEVEDVSFTWDETSKRILRKTGSLGTDVGVRLDEAARARGVKSGDVLGIDWGRHRVFVARVAPTEVIVAHVDAADVVTAARLAWEVGNTHTPLFAGAQMGEFAMPWSEPLMALLRHLPGVTADVGVVALDGMQRLGGGGEHVHHHAHSHGHDYDHGHVHAHDQRDEHEEEL